MKIIIDHIPKSPKKRPGTKILPTSITIHSTANSKSTAMNERNWLVNPSNTRVASWHIAIDEKQVVEAVPLDEVCYHAGNRKGNNTSIGIEICESGDREKTIRNAIELVAKMLHERNWGVDRIKRHFDWSGKNCPRILNYNNWEGWIKFKKDVQIELDKLNNKDDISPWAIGGYKFVTQNNISDGKRPGDNVTREEVWTMLSRFKENINQK